MIRYGGPAPLDLIALQLAAEWGVPPWVVMDSEESAWWAARWGVYQDELAEYRKSQSHSGNDQNRR